ncbi:MAG TPA: DUF5011 domain-containing protein [Candidatus Hydrogenedentes bacterium]|nr:DUF5011 domain-containing protein [Candidatus Hydrogenedentota bacterium]
MKGQLGFGLLTGAMCAAIALATAPARAQDIDNPLGMTVTHDLPNGYTAGQDVTVAVTLAVAESGTILALGLVEELPPGWSFKALGESSAPLPAIFPAAGAGGELGFVWITAPSTFPYTLRFVLTPPATQTESQELRGQAEYRLETGGARRTDVAVLVLDPGIDYEPPVITLLGGEIVAVEQYQPYIEPGYTAVDDVDGDITGWVEVEGAVDTAVLGDYELTYRVSDSAGNAASVTRTVRVVEPNTTVKGFFCCSGDMAASGPGRYCDLGVLVGVGLSLFLLRRPRRGEIL